MFGYSTALRSMTRDEEMSDSFGFEDKRKVSPQAAHKENAKRPAITGLLDASLAFRFLSDPIITDKCDTLAKDEFVVQMAQQLLEALQASTVLEDGTFNDSAFEHFALVMRIWRIEVFNSQIYQMLCKGCVVVDIIAKLSNEVENEQIGERMCRIKADHNLSDILQLKSSPATMIRGLLIILLGYWSYKKLPLPLGFDEKLMCFDGDCGHKGHKVVEDGSEFIRTLTTVSKGCDDVEAQICYVTRFAGDLKGLREALGKVYGTRPHKHVFDVIKITQFEWEVSARKKQYYVTLENISSLNRGFNPWSSGKFI
ncbi:Unknown protein [Striga hermonthica]|uniref:Uncharacterized protein n=1 Tax=Striga hermonthica TaxID=68872 RepID=A0A9N7RBP4_STRHE|nr:Unknown protein [Striga hermonthica]